MTFQNAERVDAKTLESLAGQIREGVEMATPGMKRLLIGIDVSISAVLLALTSSGGGIAIIVGVIGFLICAPGMVNESRA